MALTERPQVQQRDSGFSGSWSGDTHHCMQPDQHVVPALVPLLQGRILYSLSRAHLPCHSCSRVRRIGGATDRVERPRLPVSHQQPTRGTGQDVCSLKTAALAQQQETTGHQRSLHLRVLQTWHPNRKAQQQQRRVINSAGVDAAGGASRANSPVPRHVVRNSRASSH